MKNILFLLLYSIMFLSTRAQSYSDKYDLEFRKFNNCSWGWPGKFGKFISLSIDSTIQVNGKYPLKLSSSVGKYRSAKSNVYTAFSLMQIVVLPPYKEGENCTVSHHIKTNTLNNVFLVVRSFNEYEQMLFEDSVSLDNSKWSEKALSFKLTDEKAIEISINYYGNDEPEQDVWLDKVNIKIAGKDIGQKSVFSIDKQIEEELNESLKKEHIIPLSSDKKSLSSVFLNHKKNKIIALGECTHGSYTVKESIYSFIKNLIEEHTVKLILFELPSDMLLKYDLYVQGLTPENYISNIEQDARCFFHDYKLFAELLSWIRTYNLAHVRKVHFGGFDGMPIPQFALSQYYSILMDEGTLTPYLELIKNRKFDELLDQTKSNVHLKKRLDSESFEYLLSMLQRIIHDRSFIIYDKKERDFEMADRVRNAVEVFLKNGEKAILHAHSGHLTKKPIIGGNCFPMGYFLNDWYGDNYFSISYQVARGAYTDNECDQISNFSAVCSLSKSLPQSFESVSLGSGFDYFYYPSLHLGDKIVLLNQMGRNSCNRKKEVFMSLKGHFDGYVFIRESEPLRDVDNNPVSYMMEYVTSTKYK